MRFHSTATYLSNYPRVAGFSLSASRMASAPWLEIFKRKKKKTRFHERHSFGWGERRKQSGGVRRESFERGLVRNGGEEWAEGERKEREYPEYIETGDRTGVVMPTNYYLRPRASLLKGSPSAPSIQPRTWPRPRAPVASIWIFFLWSPGVSSTWERRDARILLGSAIPLSPPTLLFAATLLSLLLRHCGSRYIGDLSSVPGPRRPFVAFLARCATRLAGSMRATRRRWRLQRRYASARALETFEDVRRAALWWVWRVFRDSELRLGFWGWMKMRTLFLLPRLLSTLPLFSCARIFIQLKMTFLLNVTKYK